jgi:hypothetical protein
MQDKQDEPDDISRLLRLKRFEQPPPEYFEDFLREFKDRQRAQLLREPVWRIAWDRMCAFFGEQMPGRLGYGLASTAVLVAAGIASFNILESRPVEMASAAPQQRPAAQLASLNLNTQVQLPDLPSIVRRTAPTAPFSAPRYVMDTRPVSYEPPSSF